MLILQQRPVCCMNRAQCGKRPYCKRRQQQTSKLFDTSMLIVLTSPAWHSWGQWNHCGFSLSAVLTAPSSGSDFPCHETYMELKEEVGSIKGSEQHLSRRTDETYLAERIGGQGEQSGRLEGRKCSTWGGESGVTQELEEKEREYSTWSKSLGIGSVALLVVPVDAHSNYTKIYK